MRILSVDITGAEEKTRTSTHLRVHEPESCASTNSATSAYSNQLKPRIIKVLEGFSSPLVVSFGARKLRKNITQERFIYRGG